MRKRMALKQLLRAPLKTLLTFLLIAAASFALFSRGMDYTVTTREIRNAEGFYHGVAALDNTVPDVTVVDTVGKSVGVGSTYETEDKPWPSQGQLEEFSSLPGVTLADRRYMTAGLVGDYKRLVDKDYLYDMDGFVLEGTYQGYEDMKSSQDCLYIKMDNIKVLAGDLKYEQGQTMKIEANALEDYVYWKNPYPRAYWKKLAVGSRCLVVGAYNANNGMEPQLGSMENGGNMAEVYDERCFCVLEDGLSDDYLEAEEFAYYRERMDKFQQDLMIYDMVYTSDTRAIPRFNERNMVISQGRPLTAGDRAGCVVSEGFLGTYGLSLGDKISVQLGEQLLGQNAVSGAQQGFEREKYTFAGQAELEIVGAYKLVDTFEARRTEQDWGYTINTIFLPRSFLPVEVPADYETRIGEFSVLIEDSHEIEAFLEASEPLVKEMGINMRFSDGGWMKIKDSFETGARTALLTMALYVLGAALALLLAVYLYVGRNQKIYAIMRTLGVPGKEAQNTLIFPLVSLAVFAIPIGGVAGLLYAKDTVLKALQGMAESAPYGYVPDAGLPAGVIALCLLLELAFISSVTLMFLRKMKKTPPLELLQDNALRAGASPKAPMGRAEPLSVPSEHGITRLAPEKLPSGGAARTRRKYRAPRQVAAYILRHMRRSKGKTAVSFGLAAVMAAGLGLFVMVQIAYQDTFQQIEVKGKAMGFSSESIRRIEDTMLVRDLYYHGQFYVRVDESGQVNSMVFTNGLERYLSEQAVEYKVSYAKGYNADSMEEGESLCLMGKAAAEAFGYQPGDQIPLLADIVYESMQENFGHDPELLQTRIKYATKMYTVIGIVEIEDTELSHSIFAAANPFSERLFCQPFEIEYSDFLLADNERADNLNRRIEEIRLQDYYCGQTASFYIDAEALKGIRRICDLLEQLFPIAVAAAVLLGVFGPGLVIIQSAKEAAFLRVLGVTKKRCRCMLVFEQMALCMAGVLLVAVFLALCNQGRFLRGMEMLAFCAGLYLLGSIFGAVAASVLVTRHKVLELLHSKE